MAKTQLISKKLLESAMNPPFVTEALALIDKGDFVTARSKLEAGMAAQSARPVEGMLALASAYWDDPDQRARDPKKSIEYLKEAIDIAPKDARPYALLGRYLLSKGLREQALNFLDRAIQLEPDNGDVRRLRDRANRQQKKQYTVVAQASDFTEQKSKRKGAGVGKAEEFKKQATRLLNLNDLDGAAAELEKAQAGIDAQVDQALGALLGADLVKADRALLEGQGKRGRGVAIVRTVIVFIFIAAFGLVLGGFLSRVMPESQGTPQEQLLKRLAADTTKSLEDVLTRSIEVEGKRVPGAVALANVLLLTEHGGDAGHLQNAEDALGQTDSAGRRTPAALLARALLADVELAKSDPDLKSDIERAAAEDKSRDDPWVLMAVAARADADDDRIAALTRAAFVPNPPARAVHALAREHAARGESALALALIERLWRTHPQHGRSLVTAVAIAALAPDARESLSPTEKQVLEVLATEIEPTDAAPVALMLGAVAVARGDDATAGQMRQRAQEQGVLVNYPGLLSVFAQLNMLEVGDFTKIQSQLETGIDQWPGEVGLRIDFTRAKVLSSLPDARVRRLRTNADNKIEENRLILPLGALNIDFRAPTLPLRPSFDTRFFPEDAINNALAIKGLTPSAAERRLRVVANLKLAEVALAGDDVETASKYVDVALEEAPSDPDVHLTKALISARKGERNAARDAIEEAQRIAPDDPRILVAAARLQLAAGDLRAARKALNRLDDEGFRSPTAYVVAAEVALSQGDIDDARAALDKARKFGGDDLQVIAAEVRVAATIGDIDAGITSARALKKRTADLGRITDQAPGVAAFLHHLDAADEPEKALDKLQELTRDRRSKAIAYLLIGDIEASRDNEGAAKTAFEEAQQAAKKRSALAEVAQRRLDELAGIDPDEKKKKKPKNKRRRRRNR